VIALWQINHQHLTATGLWRASENRIEELGRPHGIKPEQFSWKSATDQELIGVR
jgi:hypothetical protein